MLRIKNATVYAPELLGVQDILICNDRIVAMGAHLSNDLVTQTIDATGKICVPGLIDQHVHVTGGGGESSFSSRVPELMLSDCIKSGVTTVVGLLGTDSRTRSVANLVAKTKGLNQEGITAYCLTGAYEYPSPTLTGSVGDDIAFINEILGVKLAISDHRSFNPTVEELTKLACEVRVSSMLGGKAGVVHLHTGVGKRGLLDILKVIEESDLPIFHFRPTHIREGTVGAYDFAKQGGRLDFTSGGSPEQAAQTMMGYLKEVPAQQVTLSSDSNGSMPRWNEKKELVGLVAASMTTLHETTRVLVRDHGMPLEEAITFTTANVADGLNLKQKGRLFVGGDGDVTILDADLAIDGVVAKGRVMMENKALLVRGKFEG